MVQAEGRASAKALRQDGACRCEDQRGGPGVEAALVLVTGVGNEGLTGKDFFFFLQFLIFKKYSVHTHS